jgi:hypothetical protein
MGALEGTVADAVGAVGAVGAAADQVLHPPGFVDVG